MGFVPFTFVDLIDIILVAVIMYWIYRMTKGTNAPYILSGIIAVYLLWVVVRALNMELLSTILGQLISVGAIALIIVFQPELRRFLQMIGMRQKHFNFITRIFSTGEDTVQTNVVPIVTACREMSETKTGALIVIGQQSRLTQKLLQHPGTSAKPVGSLAPCQAFPFMLQLLLPVLGGNQLFLGCGFLTVQLFQFFIHGGQAPF